MTRQRSKPFVVSCADCEVSKAVDDANEAVSFYERHTRLTGHDVEWVHADLDLDGSIPDGDLKSTVRGLELHFEAGVPIGIVAAAMSRQGFTMTETMDAIHELRMGGELYEPKDDHVRAY